MFSAVSKVSDSLLGAYHQGGLRLPQRRARRPANAGKRSKTVISPLLLGPKAFPLDRMLAIFKTVVPLGGATARPPLLLPR
jgi:hypothetical protein